MEASQLPSAEELRELIELKAELNRMYQEVAATRTAGTTATTPTTVNLHLKPCFDNTGHPPNSRPICGKLGAREGPVQPRYDSRIADSLASRLEHIGSGAFRANTSPSESSCSSSEFSHSRSARG